MENEKQSLLMDRRGRLQPASDLMTPGLASSHLYHNKHLTSSISLLSHTQLRIQYHFFTKFLPFLELGYVLNLYGN